MSQDRFGNELDPDVGYARGRILTDSFAEKIKQQHAVQQINNRINALGENSLYIFTGNIRANQLETTDLGLRSEEWVGPSLFSAELRETVLAHVGGGEKHEVAVFNRTSAGIVSAILALCQPGDTLVSFAPANKPHPSVTRGAKLARVKYFGIETIAELEEIPETNGLCVITGVTSELLLLDEPTILAAIRLAKEKGLNVLVDDAYGARIRPILLNQPHALQAGADLVITNNDKAALHGPRAGIMAGKAELVVKAAAKASEYGLEGRAPIALGVLRSVQKFKPEELIGEQHIGEELFQGLSQQMGAEYVRQTLLGPELSAEHLLQYILDKKALSAQSCPVVPAEVSAAVGFILLNKYGIITTNTCGMPGARVSLRLKSNEDIVNKFGGTDKVIKAVLDSISTVADVVTDLESMRKLILG